MYAAAVKTSVERLGVLHPSRLLHPRFLPSPAYPCLSPPCCIPTPKALSSTGQLGLPEHPKHSIPHPLTQPETPSLDNQPSSPGPHSPSSPSPPLLGAQQLRPPELSDLLTFCIATPHPPPALSISTPPPAPAHPALFPSLAPPPLPPP